MIHTETYDPCYKIRMRRQVTDWRDPGRVHVAPGLPCPADAHTRITLFGNAASLCAYSAVLLVK